MTSPSGAEWRSAEILADPQALYVLLAVKDGLCGSLEDFQRHYGSDFPAPETVDELVAGGFLAQEDGRLTILSPGLEVLRSFHEDIPDVSRLLEEMKPLPIQLPTLLHLIMASLLPFTPLLLAVMPLKQLLGLVIKVLM